MKRLLILGSTGSIGTQALDVVARAGDAFEVVGLSAGTDHDSLVAQARAHGVRRIALSDEAAAARASEAWTDGEVLGGPEGLVELVAGSDADLVLNAIVGSAGLGPTIVALTEGIDLALANKESLVVGGELVMRPGRGHRRADHPDRLRAHRDPSPADRRAAGDARAADDHRFGWAVPRSVARRARRA